MGHTHTPVGGLGISPITYYNSGFECASSPDSRSRPRRCSRSRLSTSTWRPPRSSRSRRRSYDIDIAPVPALPSAVIQPPAAADMSCFVRILNKGGQPLTLTGPPGASEGYWVVPPPQTIPAGGRGDALAAGLLRRQRQRGTFSYQGAGDFSVSCPTGVVNNTVSGAGGDFVARSAAGEWGPRALSQPTATRFRSSSPSEVRHARLLDSRSRLSARTGSRRRRVPLRPRTRTSSTRAWTRCSEGSATPTATTPPRLGMSADHRLRADLLRLRRQALDDRALEGTVRARDGLRDRGLHAPDRLDRSWLRTARRDHRAAARRRRCSRTTSSTTAPPTTTGSRSRPRCTATDRSCSPAAPSCTGG